MGNYDARCDPALRSGVSRCRRAGVHTVPGRISYARPSGRGQDCDGRNLIQNQFTTARDWPFGSAVSLVLMAVVLTLLVVSMRSQSKDLL